MEIGREFDANVFDDMTARLPHCSHFMDEFASQNTPRILEDVLGTDYYSYARVSGLILSGEAKDGHQPLLDDLFENTLRRILARVNAR